MNLKSSLLCVLALPALGASQVVFQDNFNAENGGNFALNYAGFANWTVANGTVDLIGNSVYDYHPGNGLYLDLDGTSSNAGELTSTSISLAPGMYELSFVLAGRPDNGAETVNVSLGSLYSETITVVDLAPFVPTVRTINVVSATSASLQFANTGGDNYGAILDNVKLEAVPVPEPATLAVLGIGLAAVAKKRKTNAS